MFEDKDEVATVPLVAHEQAMTRLRGALWSVIVGWAVSMVSLGVVLWSVAM